MAELDRLVRLYLELEQKVFILREQHKGEDNVEEDVYLDVMDLIWWKLTEQEIQMLNSRPPHT